MSRPPQPPAKQVPNSTQALVGQLLSHRKFFEKENSQVKHLDNTSISSNSTVFLRLCDDMEYIIDSACTKIMIEECKNLKLTVNDKILTSIIEVWKSDNVNISLNSRVQTIQIDHCKNINLNYSNPNHFYSAVWTTTSQFSLKIFEDGQEKYTFNNEKDNSSEEENEEKENDSLKDELKQNIIRLIDNQLVTEELVRAENWFPITRREWGEWKTKANANAEKLRQSKEAEIKNNDEATN
ncbi:unnamed protein product [Rhizophagus irregularis]|uniref:C-CAP/cofactor C-like domain-containing protein n=1 Tax=Rhizophagus irregularis TaxID=588596 RepID=A0A2N1MTC0_9GLOM|nr:hypothetical protein RhiirC2_755928 [Rhizophagus irregularis]CAB4399344.1 unnamed protein product [Rhizophagus irregularis]CAB5360863.1 unnamed protein product [Rhizophagus irregularis]